MTWFKIDDGFNDHPKTFDASDAAIALWVRAGTWSARNLTDGFVPAGMLPRLSAEPDAVPKELCDRGLWRRTRGGFQFHDWHEYNPTAESVKAERKANAERQKRWREQKRNAVTNASTNGVSNTVTNGVTNSVSNGAPTRPDPTRPKEEDSLRSSSSVPRSRGIRIPDDFGIDTAMREWAAIKAPGVNVDAETENFVDYWKAKPGQGGVKLDWVATWRTWIRRASDRAGPHLRAVSGGYLPFTNPTDPKAYEEGAVNATIAELTDYRDDIDPVDLRDSLEYGEESRKRIPAHYQESIATVPAVAEWVRILVQDAAETGRRVPALDTGPSLLLAGPTGTGKTFEAYGAVRALTLSGLRLTWRFVTAADIYARMRPRHGVDSEDEFDRLAAVRLLVVDDLGAAKGSEWTEEINYRLINHRYEHHLPTLFTTNIALSQLRSALGERVASRLVEMTTRVAIAGTDRRRAS